MAGCLIIYSLFRSIITTSLFEYTFGDVGIDNVGVDGDIGKGGMDMDSGGGSEDSDIGRGGEDSDIGRWGMDGDSGGRGADDADGVWWFRLTRHKFSASFLASFIDLNIPASNLRL